MNRCSQRAARQEAQQHYLDADGPSGSGHSDENMDDAQQVMPEGSPAGSPVSTRNSDSAAEEDASLGDMASDSPGDEQGNEEYDDVGDGNRITALVQSLLQQLDTEDPQNLMTIEYLTAILEQGPTEIGADGEESDVDADLAGAELEALGDGGYNLQPTNATEGNATASTVNRYKDLLEQPLWTCEFTQDNGDKFLKCKLQPFIGCWLLCCCWKENETNCVSMSAGSEVTVGQFSFAFLKEKTASRTRDTAADRQLRFLKEVCFPAGNHVPPSLYVIRKMLGVPDPRDFEMHVCVGDKCLFTPRAQSEWLAHCDEKCDCGHMRFRMVNTASGPRPVPQKVI